MTGKVTLREITAATVRRICDLAVADDQLMLVATNAQSLAQALFSPAAWYRAVYAGEEPVGFVMLEDTSLLDPPPGKPTLYLWRFMIDQRFQRLGYGREAMRLVIAHAREKGFDKLDLSYVPVPNSAERFYLSLGFRHTGRVDEGEVVLELPLRD